MAARVKKFRELYVHYDYPDGVVGGIGRMMWRGGGWEIRYDRLEPGKPTREVQEFTGFGEEELAAALLLERWWDERRIRDADAVLQAHKRAKELMSANVESFLSHRLYDAIVDNRVRPSHRVFDNGIAPREWWETVGREYLPPAGFGCRCQLFPVNKRRASRMLDSGEAFDLTNGLPPGTAVDQRWNKWRTRFLIAWEQAVKLGHSEREARSIALAEAKAEIQFDAEREMAHVRWFERR